MKRLSQTLSGWGRWDEVWQVPRSGGITQARARLGWKSWPNCSGALRSRWPRSSPVAPGWGVGG